MHDGITFWHNFGFASFSAFPVPVRKRLQGIPTVHYRLYFIHIILPLICEISCLKVYTIFLLSHLFANILKFFKEYKQDIDRLAELGITIDSVNTAATVVQKENSNGKTGNE